MAGEQRSNERAESASELASPWMTIWTAPRDTVRRVAAVSPGAWIWLLIVAGGLHRVLSRLSGLPYVEDIPPDRLLTLALAAGPITGLVIVFALGPLLHLVLVRLGGRAPWVATRTAIAWGMAPSVPAVILWGVMIAANGPGVLTTQTLTLASNDAHAFVLGLDLAVELALTIWGFAIEIAALADLHRVQIWRVLAGELAVGAVLLAVAGAILLVSGAAT